MEQKLHKNYSLKPYNTFGLEAMTQWFYPIASLDAFLKDLPELRKLNLPFFVLGGGSNVLLTQNFSGLVLHVGLNGINLVNETKDYVELSVAAGENWHDVVRYAVAQHYWGIENLSLIPGQMGAAPIQNIGAYGVELKDVFLSCHAIELATGKLKQFDNNACEFGYRHSFFKKHKNQFLITAVQLRLSKLPHPKLDYRGLTDALQQEGITQPTLNDISQLIIKIRQEKLPDPKKIGNAGSFFKNPTLEVEEFNRFLKHFPHCPHFKVSPTHYKIPAAWLIEQCGFKGKQINHVGVHEKQALVLVNHGHGTGQALVNLAHEIQDAVTNKFSLNLEPEVNII